MTKHYQNASIDVLATQTREERPVNSVNIYPCVITPSEGNAVAG